MQQQQRVLVLDNGGHTVKAGYAGTDEPSFVVPNCFARPKNNLTKIVADETEDFRTSGIFSNLRYTRPFERGFLTNWGAQADVWNRLFSPKFLDVDPACTTLLVTEPCMNLTPLKAQMDEVVFEQYGFASYCRAISPRLAREDAVGTGRVASLIVDCGFSFSHAVPIFDGYTVEAGVRRTPVGGKMLTNYLKEVISYRQCNMLDESLVMRRVKERACYVATDFCEELKRLETAKAAVYVLPDYRTVQDGYLKIPHEKEEDEEEEEEDGEEAKGEEEKEGGGGRERERKRRKTENISSEEEVAVTEEAERSLQKLSLKNERIAVPEILFSPSDIGIQRGGIVDTAVEAINACPADLAPLLYANVVLIGGSCQFPGFKERFQRELRSRAPDHLHVNVSIPEDPSLCAWKGGSIVASAQTFSRECVTKTEYEEYGSSICERRFVKW